MITKQTPGGDDNSWSRAIVAVIAVLFGGPFRNHPFLNSVFLVVLSASVVLMALGMTGVIR